MAACGNLGIAELSADIWKLKMFLRRSRAVK